MTPLRIFVKLTQLFGTQNGAMHLSIAGRTVSRERHGCHDFTAHAQNSSCAWTSRCKTLAIAASSALKHALVHCIAVTARRLIRKQVHRKRCFICFPIMAVTGHTIEAKVLGAAYICCLGEDHASSPSRLHQRLKQLPQSAYKASEVVLPIQLIQVATQVLQRRTAPRHCTVSRTNSGFHTRFAGCTMPPPQQLHVQLCFNGRPLQSCILISVWYHMQVTCVFVVWPHMHSKLELPLVIAGIQVREDKQQLLPLICRSHHCEPAVSLGKC